MTTHRFILLLCIAVVLTVLDGCASGLRGSSPYVVPSAESRDANKAQALTMQAVELMHSDPDRAQKLLCEALAADLYHGAAHNNLGVILLRQNKFYEAANEFEWARKLMPGHPDPRMNLGLTLEKAGRFDEALCAYGTALEVYTGHIPTMQAMARLQIRRDRVDANTKTMLGEIALSGESKQWRDWAQQQLAKLKGDNQS